MEIVIGGLGVFCWISMGFGTRTLLRNSGHTLWDWPLIPFVWPLMLIVIAYVPSMFKSE